VLVLEASGSDRQFWIRSPSLTINYAKAALELGHHTDGHTALNGRKAIGTRKEVMAEQAYNRWAYECSGTGAGFRRIGPLAGRRAGWDSCAQASIDAMETQSDAQAQGGTSLVQNLERCR